MGDRPLPNLDLSDSTVNTLSTTAGSIYWILSRNYNNSYWHRYYHLWVLLKKYKHIYGFKEGIKSVYQINPNERLGFGVQKMALVDKYLVYLYQSSLKEWAMFHSHRYFPFKWNSRCLLNRSNQIIGFNLTNRFLHQQNIAQNGLEFFQKISNILELDNPCNKNTVTLFGWKYKQNLLSDYKLLKWNL